MLDQLRSDIQNIDEKIIALLKERSLLTHEVGIFKKENGLPIYVPEVEKGIIANIRNNFPSDPDGGESLWRELMYISKREQNQTFSGEKNQIRIGIQGGKGSFNEIAIHDFLGRKAIPEREIEYCYTTEGVLEALNNGVIEYGQFAIANSIGGLVDETIRSLGHFRWKEIDHYEIAIQHALMIHPEAKAEEITTIMGHDQALRQCEKNLARLFPEMQKIAGTEKLTDNASIAEAVGNGNLPRTTASIGHRSLADIYGLRIIAENIQDRDDNRTTFVLVSREGQDFSREEIKK